MFLVFMPKPKFLFGFILYKMNVNVIFVKLRCVVFLLFHFYTLSSTIIHSTFGHLRNGWGIRPANHYYQCDGLKTSGSMISLGVESVVSFEQIYNFYCFEIQCYINNLSYSNSFYFTLGPFPFDTSNKVKTEKKMFRVVLYNEPIHLANQLLEL